jgi:hypothetical protein
MLARRLAHRGRRRCSRPKSCIHAQHAVTPLYLPPPITAGINTRPAPPPAAPPPRANPLSICARDRFSPAVLLYAILRTGLTTNAHCWFAVKAHGRRGRMVPAQSQAHIDTRCQFAHVTGSRQILMIFTTAGGRIVNLHHFQVYRHSMVDPFGSPASFVQVGMATASNEKL